MDGDGGIADSRGERTVQRREAKELFNADMSSEEQVRFVLCLLCVVLCLLCIVRRVFCLVFGWRSEDGERWRA